MEIATFNSNSIRSRQHILERWLKEKRPEVLCLQEIKCQDHEFPRTLAEELGYNVAIFGQKGYNGVAILSQFLAHDIRYGLTLEESPEAAAESEQGEARYIEAEIEGIRICNVYAPNGNPVGSENFSKKLLWLRALCKLFEERVEEEVVVCGDFNIIPNKACCHDWESWKSDAVAHPDAQGFYRLLQGYGYVNPLLLREENPPFSFWSYRGRCWERNAGCLIDHFLLSPSLADRVEGISVKKELRGWEKPSDHVPVVCRL